MAVRHTALVSGSAGTNGAWVPLDTYQNPFSIGFGVRVSGTGDITYSVQHTFDNALAVAPVTAFDHPEVSGRTISMEGNYAFPVNAIRLRITAASGAANATLDVIQAT